MVYGYDPENRLTTVTNIEGQLSVDSGDII